MYVIGDRTKLDNLIDNTRTLVTVDLGASLERIGPTYIRV